MSLEDRIRSTVDQAVAPLVKQLLDEATADRDAVVQAAKVLIYQEAEQAAQARVTDAEARGRAELDQKLEAAEQRLRAAVADSESKAAEALKAAVSAARLKEREIEMLGVSRLVEGIRGLDGATSLSEVLDALACGGSGAARAAVVVVRNDRIQGWRMSGFGARDSQAKSIDLAIADSGVLGHAIAVSRAVTTRDAHSGSAGPGFDTLPADNYGLAVPVIVSGRAVAVVYADSVGIDGLNRQVPGSWPELIEVLARHAGRCLEALASQKAAARANSPSSNAAVPTATSIAASEPSTPNGATAIGNLA